MTKIQQEEWKVFKRNPNYIISNYGRIKNLKGRILHPTDNGNGYLIFCLRGQEKKKNCYVHIAVAEMFISNKHGLNRVNHKDGNKYNNLSSNLEWCTAKYNSMHAVEKGLIKGGFDHFNTTPILDKETGIFYSSLKEAAFVKNLVWQTLYTWLTKPHRNKSSLVYV